ncbi:hypothetical protein [Breoghania sp.]|uniref:hypothetical protein n=1 Tax=Breoghania sp. TaxID=2065378 RepID=UPI00260DB32D|nr:hypothetical protein [Breoghania sp.]MDJ0932447.1 hypothetical protein [Breoghania sp.]
MYKHGTSIGLVHALIKVRQDLIGDEAEAEDWAGRLAPILSELNAIEDLHVVRHYGSKVDES